MSYTTEAAYLKDAMTKVIWASDARNSIPILGTVWIQAGNDEIVLTCTDMDARASMTIDACGTAEWSICVNAKVFAEALKPIKDTVTLDLVGDVLKVGARSMPTVPADDFPGNLVAGDACRVARMTLAGDTFRNIARKVGFAISTEETRYYLNGILIESRDGIMHAVATDGHRLAVKTFSADVQGAWEQAIIPRALIAGMGKAIGKKGNPALEIDQHADGKLIIRTGRLSIQAKVIDGTFPEWIRVVPTEFHARASYDRSALSDAVGAVNMGGKAGHAVVMDFTANATLLESRSLGDGATAKASVPCVMDGTFAPLIGFNVRYVAEVLKAFDGETVRLSLRQDTAKDGTKHGASNGSPVVWTSESEPGYRVVLMPMRV